jgi:hypothetical protein
VFRELREHRRSIVVIDVASRTIWFEPIPEEDIRRYEP